MMSGSGWIAGWLSSWTLRVAMILLAVFVTMATVGVGVAEAAGPKDRPGISAPKNPPVLPAGDDDG